MSKLGTIDLQGQSGQKYTFNIYKWGAELKDIGAVYYISNRQENADGSCARRHLSLPKRIVLSPSCFANTSITIVESHPPFRIELLGCAAHLDADPIEGDGSPASRAQGSLC